MNVLLIQPDRPPTAFPPDEVQRLEPLALEYIASGIVDDHNVRILDMRFDKNLERVLVEFAPDAVGITAYTLHVNVAKALFEQIKKWNPEIFTVVGGHHATLVPEDFSSPFIDLIVMGEGVFVFKEVMRRLEMGKDFEGISGIAYKNGDNIVRTPYEPMVDLDEFPFPARSLTKKHRKHYFYDWMRPLGSIRTSKGCPFRCSFCGCWKIAGGKYMGRRPEAIVNELLQIDEELIYFADDESLIDATRMKEVARLVKEAGIKKRYFVFVRSDTVTKHPELMEAWREIGLERVLVGLEFFRDEDLAYVGKHTTVAENTEAVRILQGMGIEILAEFMIRVEWGREDFRELTRYVRNLNLSHVGHTVLTPLPGTDLYEEVKDQLIVNDYDYVDLLHVMLPTSLPLKEFYREIVRFQMDAIPLRSRASFLWKHGVKEMPWVLNRWRRAGKQMRSMHEEYASYLQRPIKG